MEKLTLVQLAETILTLSPQQQISLTGGANNCEEKRRTATGKIKK